MSTQKEPELEQKLEQKLKHSCWNCLYLNCDKAESKSCNKNHKLKFIFNINECLDWQG